MAMRQVEPDLDFIRKVQKNGGENLKKCYQCATCSTVCNLSPEMSPFPRKEMLLAQWGQAEKLLKDPDIWLCYQCNDCSTHCPRGARPGDVLAALRTSVYEHYAFPRFMGRAVSSPKALPLLLLVPVVLIFGMMSAFTGGAVQPFHGEEYRHVIQTRFEFFFIGGNVLVFFFAFIGLMRFWNAIHSGSESKRGFISSLIITVKDILTHTNFTRCQTNKARYYAHLLVFFGFLGAMLTAGLAAIALKFPHTIFDAVPPLPLGHPIKWIGNAAGLAGFIGLTILTFRRIKDRDKVGANGYADWLFLVMLYLVFITGLSTQFIRFTGDFLLTYSSYYVHLVLVFFVLWYAPYSKFAHMFYRSLALIHLKSIGRKARQ